MYFGIEDKIIPAYYDKNSKGLSKRLNSIFFLLAGNGANGPNITAGDDI